MSYYDAPRPEKPTWRKGWIKPAIRYFQHDFKKSFTTIKGGVTLVLAKVVPAIFTATPVIPFLDEIVFWTSLTIFTVVQISKNRNSNYNKKCEAWETAQESFFLAQNNKTRT